MSSDDIARTLKLLKLYQTEGIMNDLQKLITRAKEEAANMQIDPDAAPDFMLGVVVSQYSNPMRLISSLEQLKFRVMMQQYQKVAK